MDYMPDGLDGARETCKVSKRWPLSATTSLDVLAVAENNTSRLLCYQSPARVLCAGCGASIVGGLFSVATILLLGFEFEDCCG